MQKDGAKTPEIVLVFITIADAQPPSCQKMILQKFGIVTPFKQGDSKGKLPKTSGGCKNIVKTRFFYTLQRLPPGNLQKIRHSDALQKPHFKGFSPKTALRGALGIAKLSAEQVEHGQEPAVVRRGLAVNRG